MKKLAMVFLLALVASVSFGQISISQQKTIGVIRNGSSEDVSISKSEQSITIKYMGIDEERKWNSDFVKFQGGEKEIDQLYNAFLQVLESEEKNSSVDITLGEGTTLFIEKTKVMGISYITLGNGKTKTRPLNKNQITKLFGK